MNTGDSPTPVLDAQRLDDLAGTAMAGRTIDLLDAARRRGRTRNQVRRRAVTYLTLAAAAAVAIGVLTPAGGRLLGDRFVQPAAPVLGPGALPSAVYAPPPWIPAISDAPVGRVALVLSGMVATPGWAGRSATGPILVSADGAEYRRLPGGTAHAVSLTPDGRRVAWANGAAFIGRDTSPAYVRWLTTSGPAVHGANVSVDGRRTQVESTTWSPDGRWIAASILVELPPIGDGVQELSSELAVTVIDTTTGRSTLVCRGCSSAVTFGDPKTLLLGPDAFARQPAAPPGLVLGQRPRWEDPPGSADVAPPAVLISPDQRTSLSVIKGHPEVSGPPDDFSLSVLGAKGRAVITLPITPLLGRLDDLRALAWDGQASAWVVTTPQQGGQQIWRVPLRGGTPVLLTRIPASHGLNGAGVAMIAHDVALGQRVADGHPPTWPWWQPERLRWIAGRNWPVLPMAGVLLALGGLIVVRSRRLRLSGPLQVGAARLTSRER